MPQANGKKYPQNFCGRTRRQFLWEAGGGFAGVAMAGMLGDDGFLDRQTRAADGVSKYVNPLAPRKPHFPVHVRWSQSHRYVRLQAVNERNG